LIEELEFDITWSFNAFECRVYWQDRYVWYLHWKREWSWVELIDFATSNKKNDLREDLTFNLKRELKKLDNIKIKNLWITILYEMFDIWKKEGVKYVEIVSSWGAVDFYSKFWQFMYDLWKVDIIDSEESNVFIFELI
jgi:hypothetical protein